MHIFNNWGQFTLSMARIVGKNSYRRIFLCIALTSSGQSAAEPKHSPLPQASPDSRFLNINSEDKSGNKTSCVFDKRTKLTWELKTRDKGFQNASDTYSWYAPDKKLNGGFPGYRNRGQCSLTSCDTQAYIAEINKRRLCGRTDWRLPSREELRSIVDYGVVYPGPSTNTEAFPNTKSQFYWSSTPDANDSDSAWGIGFSFGYDYAYFKSDHGYIRLVSGSKQ